MKKTKSTKRALILSALSMLICVSMLIGSTFAWFTDSVTSSGNIIKSGKLEVSMDWAEGTENPDTANWNDASKGAIFDYDKWEPGFVQVRHVKITNDGTLALKYQINIVANGLVSDLAEVIDVYYADPAVQVTGRAALNSATVLGTLNNVLEDAKTSAAGELLEGESHTVTIALKMQETAGNYYQDMSIGTDFSVQLVATQYTYESDSFNEQYDKDAKYPLVVSGKKVLGEKLVLPYDNTRVQIVVPEDALGGEYAKNVTHESLTEENGKYTYAVDFHAAADGEEVDEATGVEYEVNLKLGEFIDIEKITHKGKEITDYEYDAFTGIVTFYTESFSPFEVTYKEVAENPVAEGRKITGGIFSVNPVGFDKSLQDNDSEYIAINYKKGSETLFVVANREKTLVVAADDAANYTAINGNYDIQKNVSGNLWKAFVNDSRAFKLGVNTVYILPGNYIEATTVTISTDMDVVGLGNAEDIVIKKVGVHSTTTTKPSNRHLFNCSNSSNPEYIHVTISNLHLIADESNSYIAINKLTKKEYTAYDDNAAVQSIRKSKVKCYDLIIDKNASDNMQYAFYVNGNNAHNDGNKYTAYLYAENCDLTVRGYSQVVNTAPSYKFYHYGVTYNDTAYDRGTLRQLDYDNWDW